MLLFIANPIQTYSLAFTPTRTQANGFSLVSLLVGTVIALLVLVTSITFYKNQMLASTSLASVAAHNSSLNFFLNVLQVEALQAGYGYQTSDTEEMIALDEQLDFHDLYWAVESGVGTPSYKCQGVREKHLQDEATELTYVMFSYLEATAQSCEKNTKLNQMRWQEIEQITSIQSKDLNDYLEQNQWLVEFSLEDKVCSMFGLNTSGSIFKRLRVESLSASGLVQPNSSGVEKVQMHLCLPNVPVPS